MNHRTVHFETLGCRLNHDETEGAARSFVQNGFLADMESVTASSVENRDVVLCVVNTCTVTGKAEQKARRIVRLLLEKYPCAVVVVTGCYAELDGKSIESICPGKIVILPGTKKFILASIAESMSAGKNLYADGESLSVDALRAFVENLCRGTASEKTRPESKSALILNPFTLYTPVFEKHSRGSIKVQDGCNCACSFCRIHFARGKSVSLDASEVVRRVMEIEDRGVNEIVFTGVNLSQYSSVDSAGSPVDFAGLLGLVIRGTKNISIRISSLYPQSVDEKLCSVLADPRIQPFFHLSIQSGSDRILELMRRPHSVEHVVKSIGLIRKARRDPFISCDIIAGFPGETEDDFMMTRTLCETQDFAWIHAFPFSPRPGTPAMSMPGQVPDRIKDDRVLWLTKKAVDGKISYIERWRGETVSAVVENSRSLRIGPEKKVVHAVTENYLHVECPSENPDAFTPGSKVALKIGEPCVQSIESGREIDCLGTLVLP